MTYPLKFRAHVLMVQQEEGLSYAQTAARFRVGIASLTRWTKKLEPQTKRNKPATKIDMEALAYDVQIHPDAYQRERAQRFNVSKYGIQRALARLNVTYKKIPPAPEGRPCYQKRLSSQDSSLSKSRSPVSLFGRKRLC